MRRASDPRIVPASRAATTLAVAVLACILAIGPGARAAALPLPAQEPIPAADPALEAALLAATNAARAEHGLGPLTQDEGLARAAREHAAEMAQLDYFSHGSPVAKHDTLQKRLALAGCPLVDVAENIVMLGRPGDARAAGRQAVDDWLHSPPHRKNLLNGAYDRVGFGAARDAQGELFVVQDFGSEPAQLVGFTLVHASRVVSEVHVQIHATRATQALFHLGSDAPVTRDLPAGASTVVLTTDAEGSVPLVVGVPLGGNDFVIDDAGSVDLARGSFTPQADQPRTVLRLTGASVQQRAERGARLTLRYTPPSGTTLALFLQGSYQPAARVGPGAFALFLPDTLGVANLEVGVQGSGTAVSIVHRFHVDPGAETPSLLAGQAP
ncbi:MAG: CAP domain-containing protein [Deinococcales bacterium]